MSFEMNNFDFRRVRMLCKRNFTDEWNQIAEVSSDNEIIQFFAYFHEKDNEAHISIEKLLLEKDENGEFTPNSDDSDIIFSKSFPFLDYRDNGGAFDEAEYLKNLLDFIKECQNKIEKEYNKGN